MDMESVIEPRNPASDLLENELAQDLAAASLLLSSVLLSGEITAPKIKADVERVSRILKQGIDTCLELAAAFDATTRGGRSSQERERTQWHNR